MIFRTAPYLFAAALLHPVCACNAAKAQTIPLFEVAKFMSTSATDEQDAGNWYRMLFRVAGPNVARLKDDLNPTVALMAAWYRLRVGVNATPRKHGQLATGPLRKAEIEDFLASIEHKMRPEIPKWWRESFMKAVFVFQEPANNDYRPFAGGINLPVGTKIDRGERRTAIKIGSKSAELVNRVFDPLMKRAQLTNRHGYLTISLGKRHCHIANFDDAGFRFPLYSVDLETQQLAWTQKVWASGRHLAYGPSFHKVELSEQGDRLFVFGCDPQAIYFECFDVKTGKPTCRFSSNFWCDD